jgi:hypothetical protein
MALARKICQKMQLLIDYKKKVPFLDALVGLATFAMIYVGFFISSGLKHLHDLFATNAWPP